MKTKLFLTVIILYCTQLGFSQLSVDAGNDTILCCRLVDDSIKVLNLGGNHVAKGGIEPYKYTWSCEVFGFRYPENNPKWYYASDILNDTTASNPGFTKADLPDIEEIMFHLKVEDAQGNIGCDSVKITRSTFWIHPIYFLPKNIHRGDSVQLIGDPYFKNDYPPLTYLLSPSHGLSDPTDVNGCAKPDTSITYYLQATNALGCVSYWEEYLSINVDTTVSVNTVLAPEPECYFSRGTLFVNIPNAKTAYDLMIATTDGKIFYSGKYNNPNLQLTNLSIQQNQIYIVSIIGEQGKWVYKLLNK